MLYSDSFKKTKIDFVELPKPDDSLSFFQELKLRSEKYWEETEINSKIFGFQIQRNSKWRPGLTDGELVEFEKTMGFNFPQSLRNFYLTMNGLTKPGINVFGDREKKPAFQPMFYSYPDDLSSINEFRNWISEANQIDTMMMLSDGISNFLPVFRHRCLLTDVAGNPILSMYGNDIIYWTDNLSKMLGIELFENILNVQDFESTGGERTDIKFWLDNVDDFD